MKPSRLLARLDAEIAAAQSPVEADCKRAERIGYRARQGHVEEARQALRSLHDRYGARPHIAVSAWLNLAGGLVSHADDKGADAHDKLKRAHALSVAAGMVSLRALSAAWLAHVACAELRMESVLRHASESLASAAATDQAASALANLAVAQSLHLAGQSGTSAFWYARARHHATLEGDDATRGALVQGMAWLQMAEARRLMLNGKPDLREGIRALFRAETSSQFNELAGLPCRDAMQPMLRAQVLALQGKVQEALDLYESLLPTAGRPVPARCAAAVFADRAWCKAQLGRLDGARDDAEHALPGLDSLIHLDNRAAAHIRLADVYRALGDIDAEQRHRHHADGLWQEHAVFQARTAQLFSRLSQADSALFQG